MTTSRKIKAVLFDLDGTLIDTLTDLKDSLNTVLRGNGYPERNLDEVRRFVGNGIKKLVERGLPENAEVSTVDKCYAEMLAYYKDHSMISTKPYEGICELLSELSKQKIKIAVVTNKAQAAAEQICRQFFGSSYLVLGDNQKAKLKPHPERIHEALHILGVTQEEAIYVGDSEVDAQTAANAGLSFGAVLWGFRDREVLEQAGAKTLFSQCRELRDYILEGAL